MGDEQAEVDAVKAFDGIVKDSIVDVVDGGQFMVRTRQYVNHALRLATLLALSSSHCCVVTQAGMTG